MKNFLFILFFIPFCLSAQTKAIVDYSFKPKFSKKINKQAETNPVLKNATRQAKKGMEHLIIILKIKEGKAWAGLEELMNNDAVDLRTAKVLSQHETPFYYDLIKKKVYQCSSETFFPKNKYIIESDISLLKWKLAKQTKNILGYKCYKAITTQGDKEVIAWYTPELSYQVGPTGYGGLPGLILRLDTSKIVFAATCLELNPAEIIKIDLPNEGEYISKKRYKVLVKEIIGKQRFN